MHCLHRYCRRKPSLVIQLALTVIILSVVDIADSLSILSDSSRSRSLRISFVTGNDMKAREVENIVEEHCYSSNFMRSDVLDDDNIAFDDDHDDSDDGCALLQLDLTVLSVDLPEIQEVDTMAIAKNKALLAAQLADGPCLVEDTSLCFHALGGMPGPYIKWFQQTLKVDGLYNILAAYPDKSATAVCTLAFSPEKFADPVLFTGECHGRIVAPEPGGGFGWDSIFVPDASDRPFSQMTLAEKNVLSHRGNAVRKFADWLGHNQDALLERQNRKGVLGHQGLTFSLRPPKPLNAPLKTDR